MKPFLFAALAGCAFAAPALAQTDATPAATPAAAPAPAPSAKPALSPDDKICRSVNTTGSIMSSRVCHTRAQWAQINSANARDAEAAENARERGGRYAGGH